MEQDRLDSRDDIKVRVVSFYFYPSLLSLVALVLHVLESEMFGLYKDCILLMCFVGIVEEAHFGWL